MYGWYAIWTKARHEFKVEECLKNKGYEVFLPTILKPSIRKDRRKILKVPMFPSYIFVETNLVKETYIDIVKTQGIVNVLGWKENRAPSIPTEQINSLKILVNEEIPIKTHPFLKVGNYVKVVRGPLKGVIGMIKGFKGKRRLIVQVDLLKRAVACEISAEDVIPIDQP